jgi:predicted nucleotidyltransferase
MTTHPEKLDGVLRDLVARVVEAVHPLRIVLFGSTARGTADPESDLDLLVVVADGTPRLRTAQHLHRQMFGLPAAVDFIVATPGDLARHQANPGLIYRTILAEGKELYAA